jgi:hypothetical protein
MRSTHVAVQIAQSRRFVASEHLRCTTAGRASRICYRIHSLFASITRGSPRAAAGGHALSALRTPYSVPLRRFRVHRRVRKQCGHRSDGWSEAHWPVHPGKKRRILPDPVHDTQRILALQGGFNMISRYENQYDGGCELNCCICRHKVAGVHMRWRISRSYCESLTSPACSVEALWGTAKESYGARYRIDCLGRDRQTNLL